MVESIIRRINLIDTRVKENDLRLELYATLIPLLLSKEVFQNNKEISNFTDKLILKKTLRDYVFRSRSQIVARISREIEEYSKAQLAHAVKVMKEHISSENLTKGESYFKSDKKTEKIVSTINKYSRNKLPKSGENND
ncbi:hypothetical protein [Virgibacillus dokdonensis]|uniref:Uncharacterized protein n=1 Tax=Virgibacillus dokdonensis TaxID=302167 RepID=A0A2K9J0F0_9BACI|nr:hypothetical protein [Virgibacillus dokdonensis]AUJ25174.1 hypothetical protein A21D_02110 [Virgibacillus dokdonensis]